MKRRELNIGNIVQVGFNKVRKDKRISSEWVNVKGFDTYKRAKELLDVLNGD